MAIPVQEDDLNKDGVIEPGEQPVPVQTTSAPAPTPTPQPAPAPGTTPPPAASNAPPWLSQFRDRQDKRIADWRGGTDAFFGGLEKVFQGDLKGGFGQWNDYGDAQRAARRTAHDERMAKLGERFKMPAGFAGKVPWGQHGGKGGPPTGATGNPLYPAPGATPAQGVAPGEPNPSAPGNKPAHGAWWAGGWGGGKNRQGKGGFGGNGPGRFSKPTTPKKPATTTPATPEEEDAP